MSDRFFYTELQFDGGATEARVDLTLDQLTDGVRVLRADYDRLRKSVSREQGPTQEQFAEMSLICQAIKHAGQLIAARHECMTLCKSLTGGIK